MEFNGRIELGEGDSMKEFEGVGDGVGFVGVDFGFGGLVRLGTPRFALARYVRGRGFYRFAFFDLFEFVQGFFGGVDDTLAFAQP